LWCLPQLSKNPETEESILDWGMIVWGRGPWRSCSPAVCAQLLTLGGECQPTQDQGPGPCPTWFPSLGEDKGYCESIFLSSTASRLSLKKYQRDQRFKCKMTCM
jgi:hypothetical protein